MDEHCGCSGKTEKIEIESVGCGNFVIAQSG